MHAASVFFFFNDTATTEIYTLSLHDALPISRFRGRPLGQWLNQHAAGHFTLDRKSTRLNSSHVRISYAVFCLKKKKIRVGGTIVSARSWRSTNHTCWHMSIKRWQSRATSYPR